MTRFEEMINDVKVIKNTLHKLDIEFTKQNHDMYGNGKKGIIKRIEDLEEDNKRINKRIAYFSGAIALISSIINYIINYFK